MGKGFVWQLRAMLCLLLSMLIISSGTRCPYVFSDLGLWWLVSVSIELLHLFVLTQNNCICDNVKFILKRKWPHVFVWNICLLRARQWFFAYSQAVLPSVSVWHISGLVCYPGLHNVWCLKTIHPAGSWDSKCWLVSCCGQMGTDDVAKVHADSPRTAGRSVVCTPG